MIVADNVSFILQVKNQRGTFLSIQQPGLEILNSLENKKVILLINLATTVNPLPFSKAFTAGQLPELNQPTQLVSAITISKQIQLVEPDYVLLMMNLSHTGNNPHLITFAYLVASVMIFHNSGEFNMNSGLVQLLSRFRQMLAYSGYNWLQQKEKSLPGFYCLAYDTQQTDRNPLVNFFKELSSKATKEMENSIQTLDHLFCTRKSQKLPNPGKRTDFMKAVKKIKQDMIRQVRCRRFMGHQTTGSILKHLACHMVSQFNGGAVSVDFHELQIQLHSDIVERQKNFATELYIRKLSYKLNCIDLPMEREKILEFHDQSISETFQQFSHQVHTMDLPEFVEAWLQIRTKIKKHLDHVLGQNSAKTAEINKLLMEQLSSIEIGEDHEDIFKLASTFAFKSVGLQAKNGILQLATKLFASYLARIHTRITDQNQQISELSTKNLVLSERSAYFEKENAAYETRIDQCYGEKEQYLSDFIHKLKADDSISKEEWVKKRKQYKLRESHLENEVETLEARLTQETQARNSVQSDMEQLIGKYYDMVSKNKSKKDSAMAALVVNFQESVEGFDSTTRRLEDMEKVYNYSKEIVNENKKLHDQILRKEAKNKQYQEEQKRLYKSIQNESEAITEMQWVAEHNKGIIAQLELQNSRLKVSTAEMDAKIEVYTQCMRLLKDYMHTGKHQSLRNFVRLTQFTDIRQEIQELLA